MAPSLAAAFALRHAQRSALSRVLSLPDGSHWQVLLCDDFSHALVNTLFPPSLLRKHAVTLHALLHKSRLPIPDAPALYIVAPSTENVALVARQLSPPALYHSARLAFVSAASSPLLQALASQLPVPSPITFCADLYSHFISLDADLFTLHISDSYVRLSATDDAHTLSPLLDRIVSGLFSVLLTIGVLPVIRAQPGGAAEAVAVRLDAKLRSSLALFQSSSLSNRAFSFRRPLLLLLDRDIDFLSMLHHTWTYQALVHDCLHMQLHTVKLEPSEQDSNTQTVYQLDKEHDQFWRQNAAAPFPEVAEAIEKALTQYRTDVDQINRKAAPDSSSEGPMRTDHLANAISSLPELSKRKQNIDIHTNIATALLQNINRRSLDTFFELESRIFAEQSTISSTAAQQYKVTMLELLKGVRETSTGERRGAGSATDRLRLFLIYYTIFGQHLSETDMAEIRSVLQNAGADTSLIAHLGRLKGYRHDLVNETALTGGTINAARLKGLMTNVVNRGYRSFANVAQNAKNLILDQRKSFAVAEVLDIFMSEQARARNESLASQVLDGYLSFDPKLLPSAANIPRERTAVANLAAGSRLSTGKNPHRTVFTDAIVFVVGGGNYVEYDNCMEVAVPVSNATITRNVLYGTTELLTSEDFLNQLLTVAKRGTG
ncbi:Sec1 [Gracilaria domingensis]|nr:Sec1 [Gracilaria domingensis]